MEAIYEYSNTPDSEYGPDLSFPTDHYVPICVPTRLSNKKKFNRTETKRKKRKRRNDSDEDDPYYEPGLSDSDDDGSGFFFGNTTRNVFAERNHLYFRTGVTEQSINKLTELIDSKNWEYTKLIENKLVKKCDPAPLYLHITSYGGSVLHAFKAIDSIQNSALPVYTIVDGYAASAGTMMSVAGKKRYMTQSGYMLIHEITYGFGGKYKELKDGMANAKRWMADIEKLYGERTNITKKDLKKYMKHDYWWNFAKCKELGLVDEVWKGTSST